MSNWRDQILREFVPQVARLTLVADPDELLLDEEILEGIHKRGFDILTLDDYIAFRYDYESRFRKSWDQGGHNDLVVISRFPSDSLDTLPYDLIQIGHRLSFSLGELFPKLSYPIVAELDRRHLDTLFNAQKRYITRKLSENETIDFILLNVFEIAPTIIKQPSNLLKVLLQRHYKGIKFPAVMDERLIKLLHQKSAFRDWPLESIIPDAQEFFSFLQERWPVFLDYFASKLETDVSDVREFETRYSIVQPKLLPFDHDDVRVYIDNLFIEGFLKPVPHEHAQLLSGTWADNGIKTTPEENHQRRIKALLNNVRKKKPSTEASYIEWLDFSYRWAELVALYFERDASSVKDCKEDFDALDSEVNLLFRDWVLKRYKNLASLPATQPAMVHHIPRYLVRRLEKDSSKKIAFLLVDGLALDQWVTLRKVLTEQEPELAFRERAVFAWIPTLTSVSRQAAFAGKPPSYFPDSINTTAKEPSLWKQFLLSQGLKDNEILYFKGLKNKNIAELSDLLDSSNLRIAGIVINKVDEIMHGMKLGSAGMHNQIRQWAQQGFMQEVIDLLHRRGFDIYLSSDHGNIQAIGIGNPSEKAMAEKRGERVRIYSDKLLRANVKEKYPESLEWPSIGLPDDYLALIAQNRDAFVLDGDIIVCHGGISVEEVLVPLIQIDKRGQ